MTRRCNLDGRPLSAADQAYVKAFTAELERLSSAPWWWQAAGREDASWERLTPSQKAAHHAAGGSR